MLDRLSEPVGPTGSLQGEGLTNLLGRPPFDPLTLVLREAGQNIWDARRRKGAGAHVVPRMLVRIRTLTSIQRGVLSRLIESGDPGDDEPKTSNKLYKQLSDGGAVRVLEICDFGTTGLVGPTDPQSFVGNFVRFFFDIGSTHFESGDGGTYGYGRSSLYLAGAARTILVDSLTSGDRPERRFMAARIGHSYERSIRGRPRRFTGRHFWGKVTPDRQVHPLTGKTAEKLAKAFGMPERGAEDSGTTILIPWAEVPEHGAGDRIAKILLHNLWPKLVSATGSRAMEILVEEDGKTIPIPSPKSHPAYRLFATALLDARTRNPDRGVFPVQVLRPKRVTGHMGFSQRDARELSAPTDDLDETPERIFEQRVRHVALMRPSELVVRYVEYSGGADETEWAGVFLASEEPDLVQAFAMSEPPAHDDWVPDRLSGGNATLVRVTKNRRIPEIVGEFLGLKAITPSVSTTTSSLAGAADRFAGQFLAGDGSAPGESDGTGSGGGSGGGGAKIKAPLFIGLRAENGTRIARFQVSHSGTEELRVTGAADVDGISPKEEIPEGLVLPSIKGWRHPDGSYTKGNNCSLIPGEKYEMEVEFRGLYAINARCEPTRT